MIKSPYNLYGVYLIPYERILDKNGDRIKIERRRIEPIMSLEDLNLLKTTEEPEKLKGYHIHWHPEALTIDFFKRFDGFGQDDPLMPDRALLWLYILALSPDNEFQYSERIDIIIDYFKKFKPTMDCFTIVKNKCQYLYEIKKFGPRRTHPISHKMLGIPPSKGIELEKIDE